MPKREGRGGGDNPMSTMVNTNTNGVRFLDFESSFIKLEVVL